MDAIYIVCYIVIGTLLILMMRSMILNHKIKVLNDRCTKVFHYFAVPMLTNCKSNESGLHIGQLFKRWYDFTNQLGYRIVNMDITFIAKFKDILDNDNTKAMIMKRLYIIPTDIYMERIVKSGYEVNEDTLMQYEMIYLEFNEDLHNIDLWCGKFRFDELEANKSLAVVSNLNEILKYICKECTLEKRSIGPLVGDFYTFYELSEKEQSV